MANDINMLLNDLENSLGVVITLHDWFRLASLESSYATHEQPFCRKIKENHEGDCIAWCREKTSRESYRFHSGRYLPCPFGNGEIQIPLQHEGIIYGILFANPKGGSGQKEIDEDRIQALRRTLLFMSVPLAELLARQMNRQDISRKQQILRIIGKREDCDLKALGEELALSQDRARHVVKELFGKSLTDLVLENRMTRAAQTLIHSDKSITMIALENGYEDPLYFSRRFRKVMKMSPREFRVRNRLSP